MYAVHKYECKYTRIYVYVWNVYIGVQSGACISVNVSAVISVCVWICRCIFVRVYGVLMYI